MASIHDFENDEAWKTYFSNLEFAGEPTETQITKLKNKWYKKNIDPDFEISSAAPAPKSEPSTTHSSTQSNTQHTRETNTAPHPPQESASGFGAEEAEEPSTAQDTPFTPSGNAYADAQVMAEKLSMMLRKIVSAMEMSQLKSLVMGNKLQSAWALLHMSYLFLSFWFYIPYFGWNVVAYHRPLKVSMILYAFSTYTELGMPQFNREYLRKMLDSGNTHFLLYSIIFIIDDETRLGAALWPLFVYSTFQVFNWVKLSFVPAVAPSVAAEFRSFELTRMFEQMRQPALVMAADLEVKLFFIILVFAILGLFGVGNQQLAGVFFYYQLLRLRYRVSPETQRSVAMTKHTVDGYLYSARCPEMIRNLYVKALTWVGYV